MSHRVLLINPWIYDFAAYDLWAAPLGLLYIGAVLREAGYEVRLLDCLDRHHPQVLEAWGRDQPKMNEYGCGKFYRTVVPKPALFAQVPRYYARYGLPLAAFDAELARGPAPDAVLVTSGMTYWYPGVFEAIRRVKACYPTVPVLLGGIYATLCHEHAVAHAGADAVIAGEGEGAALSWLNALTGHTSEPGSTSLDALPYPAYDLYHHLDFVSLTTSRGCPFHCTYCATDQLRARGFQQRDPHLVATEIRHWNQAHDVHDMAFYDDALFVNADQHIHIILDDLLEWGLDVRLHTPNGLHARYIHKALALKMYRAGFKTVRLSLETVNMGRQREIGPKVTTDELVRAIDCLRQAGFSGREIGVYILMGLPEQPLQEVMDSIDFVHGCGARAYLALFSPIPGTVEWRHAVANGEIAADADPLWQNNTIFSTLGGHLDDQACQQVKDRARRGNAYIT